MFLKTLYDYSLGIIYNFYLGILIKLLSYKYKIKEIKINWNDMSLDIKEINIKGGVYIDHINLNFFNININKIFIKYSYVENDYITVDNKIKDKNIKSSIDIIKDYINSIIVDRLNIKIKYLNLNLDFKTTQSGASALNKENTTLKLKSYNLNYKKKKVLSNFTLYLNENKIIDNSDIKIDIKFRPFKIYILDKKFNIKLNKDMFQKTTNSNAFLLDSFLIYSDLPTSLNYLSDNIDEEYEIIDKTENDYTNFEEINLDKIVNNCIYLININLNIEIIDCNNIKKLLIIKGLTSTIESKDKFDISVNNIEFKEHNNIILKNSKFRFFVINIDKNRLNIKFSSPFEVILYQDTFNYLLPIYNYFVNDSKELWFLNNVAISSIKFKLTFIPNSEKYYQIDRISIKLSHINRYNIEFKKLSKHVQNIWLNDLQYAKIKYVMKKLIK